MASWMVSSLPFLRHGELMKKRFADEQIVGILREAEADALKAIKTP